MEDEVAHHPGRMRPPSRPKAGADRHHSGCAGPRRARATRAERVDATGTRRVLLIIGGGIAAYKSLDLIRRLHERGLAVRCILTSAAQEFITPLSAGALAGERVFTDLFDPHDRVRRRPYPAGA